jgi:hypothetical protein
MKQTGIFAICISAIVLSFCTTSCDDPGSDKKIAYAPDDAAVYVSKNGDDANPGTYLEPKLTIAGALAATGGGKTKILVSAGTYEESVTLTDGVSLYGGFSASSWGRRKIADRTDAAYRTVIEGSNSVTFAVAFTGASTESWVLEGFTIITNHAENSYGINHVADGTVTVRYNTMHGGSGRNESNGIYVHGSDSKMIVQYNNINGGSSTDSSSNGIYIETAADQIITDNTINGGTGDYASRGIVATYPLAGTSLIARNTINGGASTSIFGLDLTHYADSATLACQIFANRITCTEGVYSYGIYCMGSADARAIEPVICNNVIVAAASSMSHGLYFVNVDGTPLVHNNTIAISSTNDQAYGIYSHGVADRQSTPDVRNNIIIGLGGAEFGLIEYLNGLCSKILNNDIFGCLVTFSSNGTPYEDIADLNTLRGPDTTGNISVDPSLSTAYAPTGATPAAVRNGGLDLSGVAVFPENATGQKIDFAGTARTTPWSIGAYERN